MRSFSKEEQIAQGGAPYIFRLNLGTFGDFSSFSFYYSHHITSGEGGMVCTKNSKYLEIIKSLRSHGWSRDLSNNKSLSNKYKHIDKNWIFINSGFNLRTTDINAAIGLEQLKRIKKILSIRKNVVNRPD